MRHLKTITCITVSIVLCACANMGAREGSSSVASSLNAVRNFTVSDLEDADRIAQAQDPPDAVAHQCFTGLVTFLQEQRRANQAALTVSGAFSALEAGRVGIAKSASLVSKAQLQTLELACGPLVIDTQNQGVGFVAAIAALGAK